MNQILGRGYRGRYFLTHLKVQCALVSLSHKWGWGTGRIMVGFTAQSLLHDSFNPSKFANLNQAHDRPEAPYRPP